MPSLLKPVVLDLDNTVIQQSEFLARAQPAVVGWRHHDSALRYWSYKTFLRGLADDVKAKLGAVEGHCFFYGTSDSHHLTWALLTGLNRKPVSVVYFDAHADLNHMCMGRLRVGAGTWVSRAAELPGVDRILGFGMDKDLRYIGNPPVPIGPYTHELNFVQSGKVEFYMNNYPRSRFFGRFKATSRCAQFKPGWFSTDVAWKSFRELGVKKVITEAIDALATEDIYISIDKDAIRPSESVTNYTGRFAGEMRLEQLTEALGLIAKRKNIVAMDVTGDGSSPAFGKEYWGKEMFRKWKDGDVDASLFTKPESVAINSRINLEILRAIGVPVRDEARI
jgi:Arginase family